MQADVRYLIGGEVLAQNDFPKLKINSGGVFPTIEVINNLGVTGTLSVGTYTVATLPSASANAGCIAQVTDSSVTTHGSTVAGSGSSRVLLFSNGTNWLVN